MKKKFLIPRAYENDNLPIGRESPWLAPLAGYSDLPFRLLCREQGASVCVTEMFSAKGLFYKGSATAELLASCPEDQPLVVQLFGGEKKSIVLAVRTLKEHGYRNLDFNMGCPVKKVLRQKAGAWLLGETAAALELARAILKEARTDSAFNPVRVGFKLRLGLKPGDSPLPDLALRLEDAGASWITLHPRYASQGYSGFADWEKLMRLKEKLSIPLIASGDLLDAKAGLACLDQTGANGLMYARGALRNPAIFRDHLSLCQGRDLGESGRESIIPLLLRHLHFAKNFGATHKSFTKLRSIVPRYVRLFRGSQELRNRLSACSDWEKLESLIKETANMETQA